MQATKQQLQHIHAALHRLGLLQHKPDIVSGYTAGRSESSRDMTTEEAAALLADLNRQQADKQKDQDSKDKMIRHIFAMAHEMGWIKRVTVAHPNGLAQKNDASDLHAWIEKYGYLKKPLSKYTYQELPKLVTAFKNVYSGWLRSRK